mgnify:CR=1 FL=1
MGNFCPQCGRPLQEGEVCNCTAQAAPNPAPAAPTPTPVAPNPVTPHQHRYRLHQVRVHVKLNRALKIWLQR